MYIVAFLITYLLFRYQVNHDGILKMSGEETQDLFLYCIIGLLIGAHLFSIIFYSDFSYYLKHPLKMFWPFEDGKFIGLPGMSYHGGAVGCLVGGAIYAWRKKRNLLLLADIMCTGIPLGYTFGRLGNFINGELYGRVSASPFAMVFPSAQRFSTSEEWVRSFCSRIGLDYGSSAQVNLPRHPSQLYEALFEGIVLFLILWFLVRPWYLKRKKAPGTMFAFYLFGYGLFRFFIEYCRQPDRDIGYVIAWGQQSDNIALFQSFLNFSKGQVFCFLMMVAGLALYFICNRRHRA